MSIVIGKVEYIEQRHTNGSITLRRKIAKVRGKAARRAEKKARRIARESAARGE